MRISDWSSDVCSSDLVATLIGPAIFGVDPFDIAGAPFMPPDADYWCGTDYLGRDIMAGLLIGGRATLTVGAVAALISVGIGITFGALGGYFGGLVDTALMKVTEFFQVLPTLQIGRASGRERVCQ